jgi:hopanoid biosynthesis associated protein HpnK
MPGKAAKIVVHADDFGISERINDGILQAHCHGILTCASIIANGEAFGHAVALARSTPSLDIGIHLTLIEEKPLSKPADIPTLVNSHGNFHPHVTHFARRYLAGRINLQEVRKELEAQVQKVFAAGLVPSHFDSHQHVHVLPGILKIVLELSQKYGVQSIRLPREAGLLGKMRRVPFTRVVQAMVLNAFCRMANGRIQRRTDSFAGFLYGGNLNKENLLNVLKHLPRHGTCEIMCHPGLEGPGSRYGHWQYHWLDELDALLDAEIKQFVHDEGIQLISWRELCSHS